MTAATTHLEDDTRADAGRPFPRGWLIAGFAVIVLFVTSIGAWSALAPLQGAVVAPGVVAVSGYRKKIQHLEGGIVEKILVRDGDHVRRGQELIRLRNVRPAARLAQLESQYLEARAIVARLIAARDGLDDIAFPDELVKKAEQDPAVATVLDAQRDILRGQRHLAGERQAIVERKIAQARERINGLKGRIEAAQRRRALLRKELRTVEAAIKRKLMPATKRLPLQRGLAEIAGDLADYRADRERLQQNIAELELQIGEQRAKRRATLDETLREQRARVFDLSQRLLGARDVLRRTRILAPLDGVVVDLRVHSDDGVIEPGQALMEIVPSNDELVVETYIDPEDIDEIRVGQRADVRLTAQSRRRSTPLQGVLADVSADRLSDPRSGAEYYRGRVVLDPESLSSSGIRLVAGMGAQVFLLTGRRTPLDYLLSPITSSLNRGLREN